MKKVLILALVTCLYMSSFGQSDKSWLVKWSPASLSAGKITLGAEYNYNCKNSLEFLVGIPFDVQYGVTYKGHRTDFKTNAFSAMFGFRHYFGDKDMRGFYIEPYAKYLESRTEGTYIGTLESQDALFEQTSVYKGIGLGAQLGAQFFIGDRFSVDLFILGPEANYSTINSTAVDITNALPWSEIRASEAEREIRDFISDIPLVGDKTEITVVPEEKAIKASYKGFMPGFRAGLSFGFRL